ncbi:telomerase protein component 1-like [Physella acuta]|uniref:telomerase protein component 1-like n=1 Tax=Physella acuta TaxID=109671 RepID=UPI0027DC0CB5|nr:telomerase protein component 1-like [Physella acuta]
MDNKSKNLLQSSLLDNFTKDSSLSSGLALTSGLLNTHSSVSKLNVGLKSTSLLSANLKTDSSLLSSLSNKLLSTQATSSSAGAKPSLNISLSTSTKPSTSLSALSTFSSLKPTQSLKDSTLTRPPLLESGLSKLTLKTETELSYKSLLTGATTVKRDVQVESSSSKAPNLKRKLASKSLPEKKKIVESDTGILLSQAIKQYSIDPPEYYIKCETDDRFMEVEYLPNFIPPSNDVKLNQGVKTPLNKIIEFKRQLINSVSGSLIRQPNFKNTFDDTRLEIQKRVSEIVDYDPEFILKVALYSRKELNIRTTSNYLLALAANISACRYYLKKYFNASIALPSDWIEVAELFQTLDKRNVELGSLPAALRKAMIAKFPEFDKYQLGKYNKEGSIKKKRAKDKKLKEVPNSPETSAFSMRNLDDNHPSDDDFDSSPEDCGDQVLKKKQQKFTIKHLIRKLHIREPVEHVMSIIGKKYPSTIEEFYKSRLPGTWEEEKAGKRMKLPVPETWETQVSLKGNKAKTWEDLIDHKKLPYMAMLRNLRNMIKAGISPKHHNIVLKRLCDQKSVINSKQFPFRFFSAYKVLTDLEESFEENQNAIIESAENAANLDSSTTEVLRRARMNRKHERDVPEVVQRGIPRRGRGGPRRGRGGPRGSPGTGRGGQNSGLGVFRGGLVKKKTGTSQEKLPWWILKQMKKKSKITEVPYDKNLIQRYRKSLDEAVKIATVHNVQPIRGRTLLLCEIEEGDVCPTAKGLGAPRSVGEISVLMGLMCKYCCEECEMIAFSSSSYTTVELQQGTILDNMKNVFETKLKSGNRWYSSSMPSDVLLEKLRDRVQVDNILIFGEDFDPGTDSSRAIFMRNFLNHYRLIVNPNVLYVSVTFASHSVGFIDPGFQVHVNDVYISGYSDSILRFIAERGAAGQVNHVDNIDLAFQLRPIAKTQTGPVKTKPPVLHPESTLQLTSPVPCWRTVRVFISSTFRDMHGERDLLTRFVFPELRSLAEKHFINVHEVDLRWGLLEEDTKDNRTLEICLQEVSRCHFFVGLLGERYGWTPSSYQIPDTQEFDWVRHYPPGASVTELEMHLGAISKVKEARHTSFFFFRDDTFEKDIPAGFEAEFKSESEVHKNKITALKKRIRNSGLEVYDGYPCHWGGCVDGKPIVAGLDMFGARVLNNLINAISKMFPKVEVLTEEVHIHNLQWSFIEKLSSDFVGRKTLVSQIISKIKSTTLGSLGLVGKPGSGKTALMAATIMQYVNDRSGQSPNTMGVLVNIAGSAPGSNSLTATLRRLAIQINTRFGLACTLPGDFKNLVLKFKDLLEEAGKHCTSKFVIFLDGVDQMDAANEPFSLEWMPKPMPENVVIVINAVEGGKTHKSMKRLCFDEINVGGLDMWDKADLVRQTLSKHRKVLDESGFGNQMKFLMLKKDAHNPLYLKLACEELRVYGVFEKITDKLKSLPHTTSQMLQEVLVRLEEDHGKNLVSTALCLLACVREGLYPEELYELLNWCKCFDSGKFELSDFCNHSLDFSNLIPPLTFTFLIRSVMGFLNPSSTWAPVVALTNHEIRVAVRTRYLKRTDNALEIYLHKILAGYFLRQADPRKDSSWQSQNTRAFTELPYHLACCGHFNELETVLCNHKFIQTKCSLGLAAKLMDDFSPQVSFPSKIVEKNVANFLAQPRVVQYKSFVSRNIEVFVSYPSLEWQQAINEPSDTIPYKDVINMSHTAPPHIEWLNKPETANECYLTLSSFKLPVTCVAVSPNGSKFSTGSQDLSVRLYDMSTGNELCTFHGHSGYINDVCFVGDKMLCSASSDTTLCVWDVDNGHRIHTLKEHRRRVNSCAATADGKIIASGGWDCTVYLWKVANAEKMCHFNIESPVNSVQFHPLEEKIVVGSWDSQIRIYNYFHQTRIAVLRGHATSVRDLAFSLDGTHLASAALDGDIKIWAADKGAQVGHIKGHCGPISKLIFSPTGKELITAGEDHQIKVWSGDLGIPIHKIHTEKHGAAVSVSISPNGLTVAVGYHQGLVRTYDINTGVKIFENNLCKCAVRAVAFSKDGAYILAGSDDTTIQVLNSGQGSRTCTLLGHSKPVLCIETSKSYVASGSEDFTCCLYENIRQLKSSKQSQPTTKLTGHLGPVTSCTFSPDETMLATSSRDASIRIYILRDVFISDVPQPTHVLTACHADWINSCQWSNTGNYLVTASNDFNLKIWDMKSFTSKQILSGHTSAINTVSNKYGCIVSGSSDGLVKVWSHKGVLITTLAGHSLRVNACDMFVKFNKEPDVADEPSQSWAEICSMDAKPEVKRSVEHQKQVNVQDVLVVSAGDDGDVWIWKPLQCHSLASLTGHSDRVLSIQADKHNHIISCSLDQTVRLWQPNLRDEINLSKHDAPITFIDVSSTGEMAISGSRDGIVKIWQKDNSNQYKMKLSFQAHEKSVNCGTFDYNKSDFFFTGGDDNIIYSWEIKVRKGGFFVRKQLSKATQSPVSCLISMQKCGDIMYTTWDGDFHQIEGGKFYRVQKDRKYFETWITCLVLDSRNYYFGTTTGCMYETDEVRHDTDPFFKHDPKRDGFYWIHSIAASKGKVFAGTSLGYIIVNQDDTFIPYFQLKIHMQAITAVAVLLDVLVTASADSTIKIWYFTNNYSDGLTQVGQFFSPYPVCSLRIGYSLQEADKVLSLMLLAGDQLGNIHQLLWKP